MALQLTLFDWPAPAPKPARYSLFLAVFPDPLTANRIGERAARLRQAHGLRGRIRPLHHFHVTLPPLGHCSSVPPGLLSTLGQLGRDVTSRVPSFEVTLDRVLSFGSEGRNRPLVLCGKETANVALKNLHQLLGEALAKDGFRVSSTASFTPHLTLLYDRHGIPEESLEAVTWPVSEVVLVRSETGATKYEAKGRWPLRA